GTPGCRVDDREEERIVAETGRLDPGSVLGERRERTVRQIRPPAAVGVEPVRREEVGGVPIRVDRLDAAEPSGERLAPRPRRRAPVRHREPDRLPELVDARHAARSTTTTVRNSPLRAAPLEKQKNAGRSAATLRPAWKSTLQDRWD